MDMSAISICGMSFFPYRQKRLHFFQPAYGRQRAHNAYPCSGGEADESYKQPLQRPQIGRNVLQKHEMFCQEKRNGRSAADPEDAPYTAYKQDLYEEKPADMVLARPNGPHDADLPGPLVGDGRENRPD